MKTVLVTGSNGFVGRNLLTALAMVKDVEVRGFDITDDPVALPDLVRAADMIFHLAGVNRPQHDEEFRSGNSGLTQFIVATLKEAGRAIPFVISSSTQAALDNPYGMSKREAEEAVFAYGRETGAPVYVYRLTNVFGKWSRPNYNSVVSTFCHNIANGLPIAISDPAREVELVYIDDVVAAFMDVLAGRTSSADTCLSVAPTYQVTLGDLAEKIQQLRDMRTTHFIPDLGDGFTRKLHATYLSYLPTDQFSYPLKMNVDERGSFTEFIKTVDRGQVSVNISKPGITKGNHWHHTKNEKFLVVSGRGIIRFRRVGSDEITEYRVSGERLEVVDIPTGYTHNISNIGDSDLVTVMWCNETFDPERPDTFFESVEN